MTKHGRAYKVVDPGIYFLNRMTDKMHLVDIKICLTDVPRQMVMTKDNVSIDIDSIIYWHVVDPFAACFKIANLTEALMQRTKTTLRDSLGGYTLQNIIENREAVSNKIQKIIHDAARPWGVIVESILLKDIQFSTDLQEALSSAAKMQRLGEGKVILAKSEVEASKLMREASDTLNTSAAMQMRYLDTLMTMSREGDSKLIFMPEDMDEMDKLNK